MFLHSHRFTEETRSSFIRAHSPDEFHDQVVLPVIERSEFQDNATLLICHPVSSHVKKMKENAESPDTGAQTEQDFLVRGNSTQNEIKDSVIPGSQVNMSCAVRHKDGSKPCQKRDSQSADSGNLQSVPSRSAKTQESGFHACKIENLQENGIDVIVELEKAFGVSSGQWLRREQEQNGGVTTGNWNNPCNNASSKGKQEESHLPLPLSMNCTASEMKSDLLVDPGAEQLVKIYSDNIPESQETGLLPSDVNKDISVKDQMDGCPPVKNTQERQHYTEQSLIEHKTDLGVMFVKIVRCDEAHSNAVHQTDTGPETQLGNDENNVVKGPDSRAQLWESGGIGVSLIPPADSLDSTSTGKHGFSCKFYPFTFLSLF